MSRALLILALAAALGGCGRDQKSTVTPAADSPPNPTEPASAPVSSLAAYVSSAAPASGTSTD
jgi:hypothetical protein